MQRKKLPVGLVVAFAVLLLGGIFMNAGNIMKTAGLNLGAKPAAPTKLEGKQLTEEEMKQQRESMVKARLTTGRAEGSQSETGNAKKATMLIEPDLVNYKQSYNASQTSAQWYKGNSYIEKKKREAEAQRGGKTP